MKQSFAAIGRIGLRDRVSFRSGPAAGALCMALAMATFAACRPADDGAAGSSTVEGATARAGEMPATPDARLE
ncbi:MAG: hypothetical protein R3266_12550, partial [Gemmatimonadota bacterium]|nr:hypothetical protein [Gemmatimonadota bacterium]